MPKVEEFYHLKKDGEDTAKFCVEDEYEDDDENDEFEIVNPTRPRPRKPEISFANLKKD